MKPANASRQPFKCNSFMGTKLLWWNYPLVHNHRIIYLIHSCFYSWVLGVVNIFQPHLPLYLLCPIRTCSWAGLPISQTASGKGQPSFSQQRMSLLQPHPPQCVHKNLHNRVGKCQYIASIVIRLLQHYSCLLHRDLKELAGNNLSTNKRNKWWIMPFPPGIITHCTHRDRRLLHTFFGCSVWRKDWQVLENLSQKKVAPPVPDRILVASYVSAGSARSQTSLTFISTPTGLDALSPPYV